MYLCVSLCVCHVFMCVCACILQQMSPGEVTLEGLLEMSEEQVCELLQKFGANEEECARLNASLSCLRKAHQLGKGLLSSPTPTWLEHTYTWLGINYMPQSFEIFFRPSLKLQYLRCKLTKHTTVNTVSAV